MLTDQARKVNETRIAELLSNLYSLNDSPEFKTRLENIGKYLLKELAERNIRLNPTGEIADLSCFTEMVLQADDNELVERLEDWLEQSKDHETTVIEEKVDIALAAKMQLPTASWVPGSIDDFKKVQHGFMLKTHGVLKKGVTLLSPIDQTQEVTEEISLEALLRQRISSAITQGFKKILIPILCEDLTWRLIIIEADKKKNISKAILWDSIFDENAFFDPCLFARRPLKMTSTNVFKSLSRATNVKVIPHVSDKKNFDVFATLDYVARKAFHLAFSFKRPTIFLERYFIVEDRNPLRSITMQLILKVDPAIQERAIAGGAPTPKVPYVRHFSMMNSSSVADPKGKGKERVNGPLIEPIEGPKLTF